MANARLQETVLLLPLFYTNEVPGNIYFGKPQAREWDEAAIRFRPSTRHRDGNVGEVYQDRHSLCATALSTRT
jgi:hypothetical protein